ncbi:GntR family transcriptional regulator [Pikeienuella piscinae]|uniref:GntR family transcriptional regulator n=1 Tax=Pikeienuella piscinae TaxID=2748098 RepID=A0A7L5C3Z4_9RHOB|nr:GntR family transcriptional regulator [Pikeienuella piscinae]QIE56639.1 GntR family transcriptional regulator [Pikeienuella piscinae]
MSVKSLDEISHSLAMANGVRGAGPKYRLLYDQILQLIELGRWKAGDRLPPEAEFAQRMPVSLGTVQKALRLLAEDGLLVRRHGDGTYVAAPAVNAAEIRYFRFVDDTGRQLPVYPKVLSVERCGEAGPWCDFFRDEKDFVRITRLVSVNREFSAFGEFYLPASRFAMFLDYTPQALDGVAFTHLLATRFNAPALRISQRIDFAAIPARVCALIGVEPGAAGLLWSNRAHSFRDVPLYFQRFHLPPNGRSLELWDHVA